MSWGDASLYVWGGFQWGDIDVARFEQFRADGLAALEDQDIAFSGDGLARATDTRVVSGDGLAIGTLNRVFAADAFVTRLPTELFRKRLTGPLVLIEIRLLSGTIRIASRTVIAFGLAWDGRLINSGSILRSFSARGDDFRMVIDDTDTNGPVLSDLFTDSTPPEGTGVTVFLGLRDRPITDAFQIFEGKIEEVVEILEDRVTFEVVRQDTVEDVELGRLVTLDDFPDAPNDSLGSTVPLVFGNVDPHQGVVVNANARTTLAQDLLTADVIAILSDGSEFPSSGSAKIDDEVISWVSKTGDDQLNALTRGASGTIADDHSSGSEILEQGTFQVLFADHPLTSIASVRLPDDRGNLVEPVPLPVLDAIAATATWSETPRIRVPSRSTEHLRAAFQVAGGGNTASNPLSAARESASFQEKDFASIAAGQTLELERTAALGTPGDIVRVFLVAVHDASGFGNGNVVLPGLGQSFALGNADIVPTSVARRDYKAQGVTFDIDDPTHDHPGIVATSPPVPPSNIISSLDWNFPGAAIDLNTGTQASISIGNVSGGVHEGTLRADGARFPLASNQTVTGWRLGVVSGGTLGVSGFSRISPVSVVVHAPGASFALGLTHGAGGSSSLVLSNGGSFVSVPSGVGAQLQNLSQVLFVVSAISHIDFDVHIVRSMFLEFQFEETIVAAPTNVSQNRSVTEHFEITSLVGGDWNWFNDLARGGRIQATAGSGTLRMLNLYYLIEFKPFTFSAGAVPRVFCNAVGIVPTGNPVDISEQIIVQPTPVGMGLDATRISRGPYLASKTALDTDGMRADFAVHRPLSAIKLIAQLAEESGLRQFWDQGLHSLLRKPDPTALGTVLRKFTEAEIIAGSIVRSRVKWQDIINLVETAFRPDRFLREPTGSDSQDAADSIAILGERKRTRTLDLFRDLPSVQVEALRILNRQKFPRDKLSFRLPLLGIELRRGDLIELDHREVSFTAGEVLNTDLDTVGFISVRVTVIVWEV